MFGIRLISPLHPFFVAVYPILFLYSYNITLFPGHVIIRPICLMLSLVVLFLVLLGRILGNWRKAGVLISFVLVVFFSFGHVLGGFGDEFQTVELAGISFQRLLVMTWLIIFAVGSFVIIRCRCNLSAVTQFLNVTAGLLVAYNVAIITVQAISRTGLELASPAAKHQVAAVDVDTQLAPHIFYIILDGFARQDVLDRIYQYDNSAWLQSLEESGFYIASESQANYLHTAESIASSLNFDYLDKILPGIDKDSDDQALLYPAIKNSKASKILKDIGYTQVGFSTGFAGTEIVDSDVYLEHAFGADEFEREIINQTWLPYLMRVFSKGGHYRAFHFHRQRIHFIFRKLEELAASAKPMFVFAHILSPHPPFIFGRNGEEVAVSPFLAWWDGAHLLHGDRELAEQYRHYYKEQLIYISKLLKSTVEELVNQKERPIVIVVQADHGPGSDFDQESLQKSNIWERASILSAYHVEKSVQAKLYPTISPVNSFRIIFNHYFGSNYPILPDVTYFTSWSRPFQYVPLEGPAKVGDSRPAPSK
ncbi:sulfatase-like hydrolase/transferase [Oligoflexia bacterium]|nr:sulfatase-like hydrolase/transferase [Oligoflexia bacterium]